MKRLSKILATMSLLTAMCFAFGCAKPDEPDDNEEEYIDISGDGTCNGYEYVDLNLPSGILWATCNMGASSPEGFGEYFAWGETEPKSIYNWNTYKYRSNHTAFDVWQNNYDLTKYCSYYDNGYQGFTDSLTVLQSDDDAAMANWGSGWRMPTKAEWEELYQNTTRIWATQNDVKGCLFAAENGKGLFLPSAGYYWGDELCDIDDTPYGSYWSSSLCINNPAGAWYFSFSSGHSNMIDHVRSVGFTVRPVRLARQN